ncbi:MAG: hypothetical protein ACFNXY_12335 [Corynebacterium matruchotii]
MDLTLLVKALGAFFAIMNPFVNTPHTFYALPFSICVGVHSKG